MSIKEESSLSQEVEEKIISPAEESASVLVDEESEEDDDDDNEEEGGTQLGFVTSGINSTLSSPIWGDWDGGQVGGKPIWLDPMNLPTPSNLKCKTCDDPLTFLLQVYCPMTNTEEAFHRMLYVFICRKKKCVENGSVCCLRVQLPQDNPFYGYNEEDDSEIVQDAVNLCGLCG